MISPCYPSANAQQGWNPVWLQNESSGSKIWSKMGSNPTLYVQVKWPYSHLLSASHLKCMLWTGGACCFFKRYIFPTPSHTFSRCLRYCIFVHTSPFSVFNSFTYHPTSYKLNLCLALCVKSFLSSLLFSQQPYAPPPHPMAPPSPSTNSCSQGGAEQLSKTNLYIRGLPPGTTDQDLIKLCQPWVQLNTEVPLSHLSVPLQDVINHDVLLLAVCI